MNLEQLKAILWLRSRLTWNQLRRGGAFSLAGVIIALMITFGFAFGSGVIALCIGIFAPAPNPAVMGYIWDGLSLFTLFFVLVSIVNDIQRTESIDLTKLLHLPIGLRQVFFYNYISSLVSFSSILMACSMTGLALGFTFSQGPRYLGLLPLVVGFVFMVTAWVYCLRGWLVSLMVNKRRRRAIITWVSIGFVLLTQTPNLINMVWQRGSRQSKQEATRLAANATVQQPGPTSANVTTSVPPPAGAKSRPPRAPLMDPEFEQKFSRIAAQVQTWVPIFWVGNGARGIAEGDVLPTLWGGAGLFFLGWLGMRRSYRSTMKFYRADEKVVALPAPSASLSEPSAQPSVPAVSPSRPARNWVEGRLPGLAEDTAAMAFAQLRSYSRAPELRMGLVMAVFMSFLFPVMIFWSHGDQMSETAKPFLVTMIVASLWFFSMQIGNNQFGCDRDGFRALVLLPTARSRVLLGKNIALAIIMIVLMVLVLAAATILAKLPLLLVPTALLQFAMVSLMAFIVGNFASIFAPVRIAPGSLKPTKMPWQAILIAIGINMLLFPLAISPVLVPPLLGSVAASWLGLPAAPVSLVAALILAALAALLYGLSLGPLGKMMQQRETQILRAVTETAE